MKFLYNFIFAHHFIAHLKVNARKKKKCTKIKILDFKDFNQKASV